MSKVLELTPPNDALYKPKAFDFDNPFMDPKELADQLWLNMKHYNARRSVC